MRTFQDAFPDIWQGMTQDQKDAVSEWELREAEYRYKAISETCDKITADLSHVSIESLELLARLRMLHRSQVA